VLDRSCRDICEMLSRQAITTDNGSHHGIVQRSRDFPFVHGRPEQPKEDVKVIRYSDPSAKAIIPATIRVIDELVHRIANLVIDEWIHQMVEYQCCFY